MILKGRDDSLKFPRDGCNFYEFMKYQNKESFRKVSFVESQNLAFRKILCTGREERHSLLSKLDESEVGHKFGSFCTLGKLLRENSE